MRASSRLFSGDPLLPRVWAVPIRVWGTDDQPWCPRWASLLHHLINTGWVRFSFRLCVLFCLMKPVATPLRATLGEAHRQGTEDSVPLPASKELNPATGPVGQVSRACFPGGASRWTSVPQHRLPAGPQSRAGSTRGTGAQGKSSPAHRRGSWALSGPQVVPVSVSHRMRTRTRNPQHTGGNNPRACPACLFPRGSAESREARRGQDTAGLTAGGTASLRLLRLPPSPRCAGGAPCSLERLPTCLPCFLLENSREAFFNSASYCLNPFLQKIQRAGKNHWLWPLPPESPLWGP
ncbi:uncharacterized protein LOC116572461 [Mustela erminea]|uniref:uncharacterized protein LOC116572461 n=1 Tax=Mustela erminea TaxID=36723 RepID=UPI00138758B7|nr:uncharacterized protein LOC116572461 [Mustela erminea]